MARWQLQRAGTPEETHCRFCAAALPCWKQTWKPKSPRETVRFGVRVGGVYKVLEVPTGADGEMKFQEKLRRLLGLDAGAELSLNFRCKSPSGGQLALEGAGAFSAAFHCGQLSGGPVP